MKRTNAETVSYGSDLKLKATLASLTLQEMPYYNSFSTGEEL